MISTTRASIEHRADRPIVVACLAGVTALAWLLTVQLASAMHMSPESMAVGMKTAMSPAAPQLWLVAAMWSAMMVGMMVPSATPMVVAFTEWSRRGPASSGLPASVAAFVSGYLIVWLAFSAVAAGVQIALDQAGVLSGMGAISRPAIGGGVLVFAGVFQITPLKESCLQRCRTPMGFLIAEWREGPKGAAIMGIRHGTYCLGCCWLIMAVLFVVGTMHLVWMAVVAGFVLAEKVAPRWMHISALTATLLVGWGMWTIIGAWS